MGKQIGVMRTNYNLRELWDRHEANTKQNTVVHNDKQQQQHPAVLTHEPMTPEAVTLNRPTQSRITDNESLKITNTVKNDNHTPTTRLTNTTFHVSTVLHSDRHSTREEHRFTETPVSSTKAQSCIYTNSTHPKSHIKRTSPKPTTI